MGFCGAGELMSDRERREAIEYFVERWEAADGNEDRESRSFWIEFLEDVIGIPRATHHLDFERRVRGRKIDVFYEDKEILIEQKSRGVDLDKKQYHDKRNETPFEQARWYYDKLPRPMKPRWIIVCNFDEFRIHDMDGENPGHDYEVVMLDELPKLSYMFDFFKNDEQSRIVREQELSVEAGRRVAKLYGMIADRYEDIDNNHDEQESLNILIVRLVFLLYAEDAHLLQSHGAFRDYLRPIQVSQLRHAIKDLFDVLATPEGERRYIEPELDAFPYINGGLFDHREIIIPPFSDEIKLELVTYISSGFDWSEVSPTIFGAVFESTLNPETRRSGGMHYTSVENIHKVIDPLFLDDLKQKLIKIEGERSERTRSFKLHEFQERLGKITILDPACGSGNFLTESYLELRKLENRILADLRGADETPSLEGDFVPINVTLDQFYGIEINDFAVSVAKTALWIAEAQMNDVTQSIVRQEIRTLPLTSNTNIVEANALRIDWNDVVSADECDYICGNPPFVGSSIRSITQTEDMECAYGEETGWGKCDYCVGWFKKASDYITNTPCRCALVATNSIAQGEQVRPTWERLFNDGVTIDFAWRTFIWNNEAIDMAHVHCVIVGFSKTNSQEKYLFEVDGKRNTCSNINGYLTNAPNVFIPTRTSAVDGKHKPIVQGSKPVDGGGFILNVEEKDEFIEQYPQLKELIRPFIGAKEFLNGKQRYCFWLKECDKKEYAGNPVIENRLKLIREQRFASPTREFQEYADKPWVFVQDRQPSEDYLLIPRHSSERRIYIPIGFMSAYYVAPDSVYIIPGASLYDFGLLMSKMHNDWMRTIAGRIKSDYRYSPVVYNTFCYPNAGMNSKERIEAQAESILKVRECYPEKSLAELYDPDKMPYDLRETHAALDKAVEEAYGVHFNGDEEKIVTHLFQLYAEAVKAKEKRK